MCIRMTLKLFSLTQKNIQIDIQPPDRVILTLLDSLFDFLWKHTVRSFWTDLLAEDGLGGAYKSTSWLFWDCWCICGWRLLEERFGSPKRCWIVVFPGVYQSVLNRQSLSNSDVDLSKPKSSNSRNMCLRWSFRYFPPNRHKISLCKTQSCGSESRYAPTSADILRVGLTGTQPYGIMSYPWGG